VTAPDPRLGEIEARHAGITPGPWTTVRHDLSLYIEAESGELNPINLGYVGNRPENDAEFIANAPTDVAYLLTELRKRDDALARVEALADELAAEAIASRNVEREIRKGPPSTLSFVHAQHATIAHNHANRIRAAVTAAKGDGEL
jgi:hypothetical protein